MLLLGDLVENPPILIHCQIIGASFGFNKLLPTETWPKSNVLLDWLKNWHKKFNFSHLSIFISKYISLPLLGSRSPSACRCTEGYTSCSPFEQNIMTSAHYLMLFCAWSPLTDCLSHLCLTPMGRRWAETARHIWQISQQALTLYEPRRWSVPYFYKEYFK